MAMTLDEATACQVLVMYLLGQPMPPGTAITEDDAARATATVAQASFVRVGFGVSGSAAFAAGVEPRPWVAS